MHSPPIIAAAPRRPPPSAFPRLTCSPPAPFTFTPSPLLPLAFFAATSFAAASPSVSSYHEREWNRKRLVRFINYKITESIKITYIVIRRRRLPLFRHAAMPLPPPLMSFPPPPLPPPWPSLLRRRRRLPLRLLLHIICWQKEGWTEMLVEHHINIRDEKWQHLACQLLGGRWHNIIC